jgi:hypothetical protein
VTWLECLAMVAVPVTLPLGLVLVGLGKLGDGLLAWSLAMAHKWGGR